MKVLLMALLMGLFMGAETSRGPHGQYTTKLTCKKCYNVSYGNNNFNRMFQGWKCSHCGAEN
jgi:hypothetical protein